MGLKEEMPDGCNDIFHGASGFTGVISGVGYLRLLMEINCNSGLVVGFLVGRLVG
jgi:hypothetical protein